MNQSFSIILNQLISFFLMMIAGYLAARLKIISRKFLDGLSALIMKILLPVLVFANMMNGTSRSQLAQDFPILFLSAAMYIALIIIFALLAKLLRLPREQGHPGRIRLWQRRFYRYSPGYGNQPGTRSHLCGPHEHLRSGIIMDLRPLSHNTLREYRRILLEKLSQSGSGRHRPGNHPSFM